MLLKVLIIEDELIMREHLHRIINWNSEGFLIVGEAANGRYGVEMVEELDPDVILLDIKMPHMDGVEFMAALKERDIDPKIIVLSSYDDFSYASPAIDYGVVDYILKHQLTEEKMIHTLEKVKDKIRSEEERKNEIEGLKTHLGSMIDLEKELLLREIVHGVTQERFDEMMTFTPMDIKNNTIQPVIIKADINRIKSSNINAYESIWRNYIERIQPVLKSYNGGEACSIFTDTMCVLINNLNTNSLLEKTNKMNEILKSIRAIGQELMIGTFYMYVAPTADKVCQIHEAVNKVLQISKYAVFYEEQSVIYHSDIKNAKPADGDLLDAIYLSLLDAAHGREEESFICALDELFETIARQKDHEAYIYYCKKLTAFLNALQTEYSVEIKNLHSFALHKNIFHVRDMFKKDFQLLFEMILEKEHYSNPIILRTIRFIKENYMKEIDLNRISKEVNVSRTYLSALFKQETGINLMEYLTRHRIEKAKELLVTSDWRVYEIAAAVGISDTKYFSKLFKKYTGVSPSRYKL